MEKNLACPSCGRGNTKHESLTQPGTVPNPGDWTVCAWCAAVCEFGAAPDLIPRLVSETEIEAEPDDTKAIIREAVAGVRTLRGLAGGADAS